MNSRERVLAAINYQEPDKIPIDFGGHRSSGISAIAYSKLKKKLGITTGDIYVYDFIQQLAIVEPAVIDLLGVDVIELGRAFLQKPEDWKDWELPDGTPCKIPVYINTVRENDDWFLINGIGEKAAIQKKGSLYFEQLIYPLMQRGIENDDFTDLKEQIPLNMWSAAPSPGGHFDLNKTNDLNEFTEGAKKLRASTDSAIIGIFGGGLFELPQFLYRSDNYFMALASNPPKVLELSERLTSIYLPLLEKFIAAAGDSIDIILFGDDLGTNKGPMIDPEMYRMYYKPFHKIMWTKVKDLAPHLKIQLHSCGGIEPFLEDLIDAGLDMVNPVQINAHGMDPVNLKSKYNGRICFWGGGCNTQTILNRKSPDEVEAHVKELIEVWKPGGGFVFQQVHNILADVPVENMIRMFETVNKYG
ncbi:hypothetical protein N9164_02715 [Draconibacterium sp.]|nr:hypothetical protein [Draconibacterium sp.]